MLVQPSRNTVCWAVRSVKGRTTFYGSIVIALLIVGVLLVLMPASADALEISSVTAKPNDAGASNDVVANTPTRITMESVVGKGEDLAEIRVVFPRGTDVSQANVKATILDGLTRLEANETVQILSKTDVLVSFATPLVTDTLIRLEFYNVSLPAGVIALSGSYTTTEGVVVPIEPTGSVEVQDRGIAHAIISWLDGQAWCAAWNSNTFLHLFFSPQLIVSSIPAIFTGWIRALGLVALGFPLAIPVGLLLAFMRIGKNKIFRGIATTYVNIVRGTPLFLQLYIAFFGLPLLGIIIGNYALGIFVLAFNSSAYLAEIFRAGIQSIHVGQMEAARSLGMNTTQAMIYVIIPQAIRRVIPTMTSEFILLYKDTSLLAAVGVMETMMFAKTLTAASGNVTPYIVAAFYYLIVTLPLTKVATAFERKLAVADGQDRQDGSLKPRRGKGTWTPDAENDTIELSPAVHESM